LSNKKIKQKDKKTERQKCTKTKRSLAVLTIPTFKKDQLKQKERKMRKEKNQPKMIQLALKQ
jgi:hypothetical protein